VRCSDSIEQDIEALRIRNWETKPLDRIPMKKHISSGQGPPRVAVPEEKFVYVSRDSQK
jgi:hypothetical protein